jgi:hypothetical protein
MSASGPITSDRAQSVYFLNRGVSELCGDSLRCWRIRPRLLT